VRASSRVCPTVGDHIAPPLYDAWFPAVPMTYRLRCGLAPVLLSAPKRLTERDERGIPGRPFALAQASFTRPGSIVTRITMPIEFAPSLAWSRALGPEDRPCSLGLLRA
jgi:hypothetical protein